MQPSMNRKEESVSLSKVKDAARRLLPISSTARAVILAEKDVLPAVEARAKFEVFDRLLKSELGP
ncbi:MAG: hypothetical protein OK441_01230 [Thaumarchaeota archaeon]|nr:hypothetical protein [Nitrososphaerota archaeon]